MSSVGILIGLLMLSIAFTLLPASGYGQSDTTPSSSEPARAIAQSALNSLGGSTVWADIGAATATKTIVEGPGKGTTTELVNDWSQPRLRYRRIIHDSKGRVSTVLSNGDGARSFTANRIDHRFPRGADGPILVEYFPGLVLARALQDKSCRFELAHQINQLSLSAPKLGPPIQTIYQLCSPVDGQESWKIIWHFLEDSHLPYSVERGRLRVNGTAMSETVRYSVFASIQSVMVPSELTIVDPSSTSQTEKLSNIVFSKSSDIDFDQEPK